MKTILIVEDDIDLRKELKALLEGEGYLVKEVETYENTLEELLGTDADLLLLDINLPGLNGEELLRRFRKEKQTPVRCLFFFA